MRRPWPSGGGGLFHKNKKRVVGCKLVVCEEDIITSWDC